MGKTWTAGKPKEPGEKTVTELLTWIEEQICDNYCKYQDVCMNECKDPEDAEQMLYEKYCANCPMSRL